MVTKNAFAIPGSDGLLYNDWIEPYATGMRCHFYKIFKPMIMFLVQFELVMICLVLGHDALWQLSLLC